MLVQGQDLLSEMTRASPGRIAAPRLPRGWTSRPGKDCRVTPGEMRARPKRIVKGDIVTGDREPVTSR